MIIVNICDLQNLRSTNLGLREGEGGTHCKVFLLDYNIIIFFYINSSFLCKLLNIADKSKTWPENLNSKALWRSGKSFS